NRTNFLLFTHKHTHTQKSTQRSELKTHLTLPLFIEYTNSVKLSCPGGQIRDQNDKRNDSLELLYKDENTGKYDCMKDDSALSHIFVKFRTCDNCVEFDMTSIVSILVGNLVATTGIGVAVYLVASQTRTSRGPSKKKRSDKQQLVPNDVSDEQYQVSRKTLWNSTFIENGRFSQ
uniref:Uncharacterized protein n=1 Tax=Oryzias latipes TaxID=8090 RepID=A0A3P9LU98_ORYLA